MSAVIKEENARRSVRKMVIQAFVVATALAVEFVSLRASATVLMEYARVLAMEQSEK